MKKIKLKKWMAPSPAVVVMAVAVIVVISLYSFFSRVYFVKQVENTIAQNVESVATEIETSMRYAQSSVKLVSLMATRQMTGPVLQNPESFFRSKQAETPFSRIEYVRGDGWNTAYGDSSYDVSDREFFQRGMHGETGIWVDYRPLYASEAQVMVYTPLFYRDSIVGVVAGILGGNTEIRSMMDCSLFGEQVVSLICDRRMKIVSSNMDDNVYGQQFEKKSQEFMPLNVVETFKKEAVAGSTAAFSFSTDYGNSVAGVARVSNTGWVVIQMVPFHILKEFSWKNNSRAIAAILLVALFFILYLHSVYKTNRRLHSENEGRHLNVINALTESYGSAFEVNLDTGKMVAYRIHPTIEHLMQEVAGQGVRYDSLMSLYQKRMVVSEDRSAFERIANLENLRREFMKQERFELTYRIFAKNDIHYLQAHFVKPSKTRPEFVMGFKIIDDVMSAELEKRKALNEQRMELVRALDQARTADKAKSKFLFNMSHDIRTPMNAVLGYEALAKKTLWNMNISKEEKSIFERYLNNIHNAGELLLELINSVLNMARIESGVETLDETPVYTLEMTNWIVATFEQAAIQKNVLLQVSRNFKNQYVYADKVKIQQILLNVVSNAIKFTREHGLVRVSLRDCAHETPGMCNVEIVVEDTGVGISEEFMPRIFDEFEREQTALTRNVEGTGLGLSIVKKLVDLMHGTVKVTSRVGEGTRVVLTLPLRTANEDDVSPKADQNATHVKLAGKHALLVDDDPKTCEIVGEILKDAGMRVVCVESGSECVQKIDYSAAGSFDVILMDLRLPGMDGFETARKVRQLENPRNAKIPILALTANVFDEDRQRANKAGMNGLISKPVTPSELFGMLGQVLT